MSPSLMHPACRSALLLTLLCGAGAAHAGVDLIAIGSLDSEGGDLAAATAAPLENGVPGNLLGGLGSGLAYAGCNTFLALPDRGPNAVAYAPARDDTTSYIPRFHTLRMQLTANPGAGLPYLLTPSLEKTTLLHAPLLPLTYAADGAPALNAVDQRQYFSGRSDNFDASRSSGNPLNARLDPESLRVSRNGTTVFISDEYGPYVYAFDRADGSRLRAYTLPDAFAAGTLSAVGNDEIALNSRGRVANKGMEGLAISPNGQMLYGAMQSPLQQDGGSSAAYARIVRINLINGKQAQFAYPLTNIGTALKPKYPTVSDIVAVNDHQFLVDERDGKGLGDDSTAAYKKIYLIDLDGAADVSKLSGAEALAAKAVAKTEFLDLVAAFTAAGIGAKDIPAKIEGLAFGPDLVQGGKLRHTLFIANDNDFLPTITDSNHPTGIANPNRFYVFAFGKAELPGYKPQQILGNAACATPRR